MKKIFILICCVGLVQGALAQSIGIGIKGGPNFSSLRYRVKISASNRTGYHFGAYALFKFSKIGIQPELLYSKQGASVTFNSNNYDANFDYINVPILLKFYTVAGINIQVGPQFGFATSTAIKGGRFIKPKL
ncbi:MAG: outer membrane beta-barrel protein [Cyclobacteriaceae bacterium]